MSVAITGLMTSAIHNIIINLGFRHSTARYPVVWHKMLKAIGWTLWSPATVFSYAPSFHF